MAKGHIINLIITNNSGYDMTFKKDWFDSGRVADNYSWPKTINNGEKKFIKCYEKDWSLAGCSGYVIYEANNQNLAIGFSNPVAGANKLGFGSDGNNVWDSMSSHDYNPFFENIQSMFTGFGSCTGSLVNNANLLITPYANFPSTTKSHVINLAIFNYLGSDMTFKTDWFDSGRVADNQSWPKTIKNEEVASIQCYEKDWALTGCSGYVTYQANGQDIAIGFSNPLAGKNKLGVGTDGKTVWDNMDYHNYLPFRQDISTKMYAFCSCSGSDTNFALACITMDLKSWMSNINDSKYLNELSIPGTHDSCATFYYGTFSRCQYFNIDTQMELGIRFLDIRCDVSKGQLYVYHGPVYQWISLDDVLSYIINFLNKNPTESIIMSLKNEGSDSSFYDVFINQYYNKSIYNSFFYGKNSIPKLKDVRKKIVLIRRFGSGSATSPVGIDASKGWKDNSKLFTMNNGVPMAIQDLYNPSTAKDKENALKSLFADQGLYNNAIIINFLSGFEGIPTPNGPENFANQINPWCLKFLKERTKSQRTGIVPMDFPIYEKNILPNFTSALIPTIIKCNF